MNTINVLISLHRGYGLGDAIQMSSVLRHVAKYRPNWIVDFQAEEGRYCVGRGLVNGNIYLFKNNPNPDKIYDAEVEILLYDTWANWHDRPNTRISSCLHDRFGLQWDEECSRYQINVRQEVIDEVRKHWTSFIPQLQHRNKRVVAIHYRGDSSPSRKDLSHEQASIVCDHILQLGYVPLVIDWRKMSPVAERPDCGSTGRSIVSHKWGKDAEYNCAVIRECAAFIGIDSGPGKCASSTNVPTLITWTGHHPAPFHDPAPNTTHLVPVGYHGLHPVCNDEGVIKWFEKHHTVRQYNNDPVSEIKSWLTEVLK